MCQTLLDDLLYDFFRIVVVEKSNNFLTDRGLLAAAFRLAEELRKSSSAQARKSLRLIEDAMKDIGVINPSTLTKKNKSKLESAVNKAFKLQRTNDMKNGDLFIDFLLDESEKARHQYAKEYDIPKKLSKQNERLAKRQGKQSKLFIDERNDKQRKRGLLSLTLKATSTRKDSTQELLTGFKGMLEQPNYWGNYSLSNTVLGRSSIQLQTYDEVQILEYVIITVNDERRTKICENLDGTTFTVEAAMSTLLELLGKKTTESFVNYKPWLNVNDNGDFIVEQNGKQYTVDPAEIPQGWLESKGVMFPPFHGGCRSDTIPA